MLKLARKQAVERVKKAFREVFLYLRSVKAAVPKRVRLRMDCEVVRKQRVEGNPRALFHVGHVAGWTVCGCWEAGLMSDNHLYGLILHEFGHPIAYKRWNRSRQEDADKAVWEATGIPILYKSGITVQWIPTGAVRRIKADACGSGKA